jgi:hypothetical protein
MLIAPRPLSGERGVIVGLRGVSSSRKVTPVLHRRALLVLCLLILVGMLPLTALARFHDTPPAQPGFTHSSLGNLDTPPGKLLDHGPILNGSPTIAEIDPGSTGKEIAVGGKDGWLYVYHRDGSLAWKQNVLPSACTPGSNGIIHSAPSVGTLFGGSTPYVVVSYGSYQIDNCDGGVVAYNGATGALRWRFSLRAWQASQGYKPENLYGVISTPALADTDFDGQMEIGFGGFDRNVYLLNADGSVRWYYHAADTVWASPSFANVDADPELEMVVATDISANSRLVPPTINGGFVYTFDTHPRAPKRLEFRTGYLRISQNFDQVLYSSPAVSDLDGDGVKEIIIGSGCYFSPGVLGHWIKILDSRNLSVIRTLNASGCVTSSPAIADLDGNGKLDIVAVVDGAATNSAGVVQAWQYDNPNPKWTRAPSSAINGSNQRDFGLYVSISPVAADIDGNGSVEVLIGTVTGEVPVFRGSDGAQLTCANCGNAPTKTLYTWFPIASTPAIGDMDGDGDLEVAIGGTHLYSPGGDGTRGFLYVWTNFAGILGSPAGSQPAYSAPWPMFRGNPAHTGVYSPPALRPSATGISQIVEEGSSARTFHIGIKDAADGALDWTATDNQSWISLGDTSGTTPTTLDVTINPSALALGTHTGKITLNSSFGDPEINVTVRVVDEVFTVYLPLTQR